MAGTDPISPEQIRYVSRLMVQNGASLDEVDELDWTGITKAQGSQMIDQLKTAAAAPAGNTIVRTQDTESVPEGIHFLNDVVYKVQVAKQGSGKKYAKRLLAADASWEYVGKAPLYNLSDETLMTREQAAEFGQQMGVCAVCGATLTDEESIERGIGPVCATRF